MGLNTLLSLIAVTMLVGGALFKLTRDVRQHDGPIVSAWEDLKWGLDRGDEFVREQRLWLEAEHAREPLVGERKTWAQGRVEMAAQNRCAEQLREIELLIRRAWDAEHWPHRLYRRLTHRPIRWPDVPHHFAVKLVRVVAEESHAWAG